ncbi:alpha-L-fucosidase [Pedobacter frigiditerrae]|uniref:alpha-L-fucosidase n=1 Tax=Pedobacter frigiditerrae TaxID=2530452 RepID=UPI00292D0322|nr:alpha-L-fucosidase [Pedobacter frigiditerrae]
MKFQIAKHLKTCYLVFSLVFASNFLFAQTGDEEAMLNQAKLRDQEQIDKALNGWWKDSQKGKANRLAWWTDARFGMFIHWGIYSLPGGEWKGKKVDGYAEHLMRKEKISRAEYLDVAHQFNPVNFNANEWVKAAKTAGMKYFIITAKHHDGFALFDSKASGFTLAKQSPWKHDPLAELQEACKKQGIKFGFYYSHAFDWEHPDAPGNDWEYNNPGGDKLLFGGANWFDQHPELLPKAVKYVNEKAIPQILELIKNYHPDILWFDTPGKLPLSENIRILEAIRKADPNVVVNGRLARASNLNLGDYQNTADRPAEFFPVTGNWEAIPTTNESYGYSKFDKRHKTSAFLIQLLAKSASRGGNLLMNIGPKGDGAFDMADQKILTEIAKWMAVNNESIHGTTKTPLPLQPWGVSTQKGNKLYLHVFNWPSNGKLIIGGLKSDIAKAYLLTAPNKSLGFNRLNSSDLEISVPRKVADTASTVIILETKNPIKVDSVRLLSSASNTSNKLLAFDANLIGKGFKFGDGKPGRYYVDGFTKNDQEINWEFRLLQPTSFHVLLKYSADNQNAGDFEVIVDGKVFKKSSAKTAEKTDTVMEIDLADLSLVAGKHQIAIKPSHILKTGLIRLLEIDLSVN